MKIVYHRLQGGIVRQILSPVLLIISLLSRPDRMFSLEYETVSIAPAEGDNIPSNGIPLSARGVSIVLLLNARGVEAKNEILQVDQITTGNGSQLCGNIEKEDNQRIFLFSAESKARFEIQQSDVQKRERLAECPYVTRRKEKEAQVAAKLNGTLISAIEQNSILGLNAALEAGAKVSAKDTHGRPALHIAALQGNFDIAKRLIKVGSDLNAVDQSGETALMAAISNRHARIAQLLVASGANVNVVARSASGVETALLLATRHDDYNVVQLLVNAGADVNVKGSQNITAIMNVVAASYWVTNEAGGGRVEFSSLHDKILTLLIASGANVNAKDSMGMTALMHASGFGNIQIVRKLVKAGAKINERDNMGWTAIMYASDSSRVNRLESPTGHIHTVKLLIRAGANVSIRDEEGKTALTLAEDQPEIRQLLLKVGGNK